MPQGKSYDAEGNVVHEYDICCEFDCSPEWAKVECNYDFTKPPCIFNGEHLHLNQPKELKEEFRSNE